ncbi:MAG: DUF4381 domain-containing protein [Legionellaceae bacterium]|nr:DUF4381 domain-containing protein [Legionellaceae bacterium]
MADSNVLSQLRDIHMPPPVSAWPPGPAYYGVLGLFIMLFLLWLIRQRHLQYTAPKREALAELTRLKTSYLKKPEPKQTAAAITLLLKRVALVYHPRLEVASLHGNAWPEFLKKTSRRLDADIDATDQILCEAPFNPQADYHLEPLFLVARRWIKQRRKKCSN